MNQEPQTLKYHIKAIWKILFTKSYSSFPEEIMGDLTEIENIHLLTESPALDAKNLKFGHEQIISALKQVVIASGSSMTIGLFGGWGTGKSSIVENLRSNLKQNKIPVVIFDVWKHDGDALRRTFLKNMDIQLSAEPYGDGFVTKKNMLSPQVFGAVKESSEKVIIRPKRFFINLVILFIATFVVLSAILGFVVAFQKVIKISDVDHWLQSKAAAAIGVLLTTLFTGGMIFKYLDNFIKIEKTEAQREKLQDPHEFESEFHKLVSNLSAEITTMVVVFDNLDRISGDNVLKVISTIKTFLDFRSADQTKKVIFLIPCDEQAIKIHIQYSLNNEDPGYVDEFLRKFFNTSIWIPEFYENELESFAIEKLKETGIKDFDNDLLAWLVIQAFHKNPRQIVQFINILLSNYLLIKEFCESGAFARKDFYRSNLPQLAKFLILKMCFPEIINHFQEKGVYLLTDERIKKVLTKEESGHPQHQQFYDLLERTREINIDNLEPFFKLRMSKDEQLIPEINSILQQIIYDHKLTTLNAESIKKLNIPALCNSIRNRLKSSNNLRLQLSIFNGCISFAQQFQITYTTALYKDLLDFVLKVSGNDWDSVRPKLLGEGLLMKIDPFPIADSRKLISSYLRILQSANHKLSKDYTDELLSFFILFHKQFSKEHLSVFSEVLIREYLNIDFIAKILKDDEAQKVFINDKFREHIAKQLNSVNQPEQLQLYALLPSIKFEHNQIPGLLYALVPSFTRMSIATVNDENTLIMFVNLMELILDHLLPLQLPASDDVFRTLITNIRNQPNSMRFLPVILQLNKQDGLTELVQDFFVHIISVAQQEEMETLIEKLDVNVIFNANTLQQLYERSILFEKGSKLLTSKLTSKNQVTYISYLLTTSKYPQLGFAWLSMGDLSKEDHDLVMNALVKHCLENNRVVTTEKLLVLLQMIEISGEKKGYPVTVDFEVLVMTLLRRDPESEVFIFATKLLERSISQVDVGRTRLASIFIETVYEMNYSNIKKLYELLFSLFEDITAEDKNRLRDLIYLHLLHSLADNVSNLETAIYVAESPIELDLHNCETYFKDFVYISENYKNSEVSSYYQKLAAAYLLKLKKYQSKEFKDIKEGLKAIAENKADWKGRLLE